MNHQDTKAPREPIPKGLTHRFIDPLIHWNKRGKGPSMNQWINESMSQSKKLWATPVNIFLLTTPALCDSLLV